jgi:hypothetical protein
VAVDLRLVLDLVDELFDDLGDAAPTVRAREVEPVRAEALLELVEDRGWGDEVATPGRRKEVGDHHARDLLRWVGDGDVRDDRADAGFAEEVPDGSAVAKTLVDGHLVERTGPAEEELEDAVLAGVLAGDGGRPRGCRERRKDRLERRAGALADETRHRGHVPFRDQRIEHVEGHAVQSDHQHTGTHVQPGSLSCKRPEMIPAIGFRARGGA